MSSNLGIRNNNWLNIRYNDANDWVGQTGSDPNGFVRFDDPVNGLRAADKVLTNYGERYGISTVADAINRFAPPDDDNPTEAYADFVADRLGVDRNDEIDLSDPTVREQMISAMVRFETPQAADLYSSNLLDQARGEGTRDLDVAVASLAAGELEQPKQSQRQAIRPYQAARPDPFALPPTNVPINNLDTAITSLINDPFATEYEPGFSDTSLGGVFSRSLEAGARGLQADVEYFKALGNTLIGDDEAAARNIRIARVRDEAAAGPMRGIQTFEEFLQEPTFEGFLTQAVSSTGQAAASILSSFVGAGVGGLAAAGGKMLLGNSARATAKRLINDSIKRKAAGTASPDEKELADAFYDYTRSNFISPQTGALIGAGTSEYVPLAGSNLSEALESGRELDDGEAARAALIAAPQAAIGVGSEYAIFKLMGNVARSRASKEGGSVLANFASDMASATTKGGLIESGTEVLQESISVANRMDMDDTYTEEEAQLRLGQAAFAGFFAGAAGGGAAGAIGNAYSGFGDVMLEAEKRLKEGQEQRVNDQISEEQTGVGEVTGGETTPEPNSDVNAQVRAMVDPTSDKQAVWLTESQAVSYFGKSDGRIIVDGVPVYVRNIPGRGTIASTTKAVADEVAKSGASDSSIAIALGYSSSEKPASGIVVEALDKDGNVVSAEVVDPANVEQALLVAEGLAPEGGQARVIPLEQALENRKKKLDAERGPEIQDDMIFDDPDDPYYENQDGEGFAGGQVEDRPISKQRNFAFPDDPELFYQDDEMYRGEGEQTNSGDPSQFSGNAPDSDADATYEDAGEEQTYADGAVLTQGEGETVVRGEFSERKGSYYGEDLKEAEKKFRQAFPDDPNYKQYTRALMLAAVREAQNPSVQVNIERQPEDGFQLSVTYFDDLYQIDSKGQSERVTIDQFVKKAVGKASQVKPEWRNVQIRRPDQSIVKGNASLHDLINSGRRLVAQRTGEIFSSVPAETALSEILGELLLQGYQVFDSQDNQIIGFDDLFSSNAYDKVGRFTGDPELKATGDIELRSLTRSGGGLRDPGVNRETDLESPAADLQSATDEEIEARLEELEGERIIGGTESIVETRSVGDPRKGDVEFVSLPKGARSVSVGNKPGLIEQETDPTQKAVLADEAVRLKKALDARKVEQEYGEPPVQQQTEEDIDVYRGGLRQKRDKRRTPVPGNKLLQDTFDANQEKARKERRAEMKAKWDAYKKQRLAEHSKAAGFGAQPIKTTKEAFNVKLPDEYAQYEQQQAQAQEQAEAQAQPQPKAQAKPQPKAQPKAEPKPEPKVEEKVEQQAEPEVDSNAKLGEAVNFKRASKNPRSFKTNKTFQAMKDVVVEAYPDLADVTIVSMSQILNKTRAQAEKIYGADVIASIWSNLDRTYQRDGKVQIAGRYIQEDNIVLINETGSTTMDAMVLAHELGHAIMRMEQEKALLNPAIRKRLEAAYEKDPLFKEYYEPQLGYKVGFDEWYADQVSLWATKKYLNRQAKNLTESHFKKVVQSLRRAWNKVKSEVLKTRLNWDRDVDTSFEAYMENVVTRAQAKEAVNSVKEKILPKRIREYLSDNGGEKQGRYYARKFAGDILGLFNSIFFTADARLRKVAGNEIADYFYVRSQELEGKDYSGGKMGFLRQRNVTVNEWKDRFEDEVGLLSDEDTKEALVVAIDDTIDTKDMLPDSKERKIREFLDAFYDEYILPSGTNIKRQSNFFPIVLNLLEVTHGKPDRFAELIEQYSKNPSMKEKKAIKKALNNLNRYSEAVQGEGGVDVVGDIEGKFNPSYRAERHRTLTKDIPRKVLFKEGFLADPDVAFMEYMNHMIKRVEFNRATGGEANLKAKLDELGISERETAEQIISTYLGYQKDPIQPWLKTLNSYGQFLQFITILPFAAIASLPDLAGPIINAKEISALSYGFKAFAQTIKNRDDAAQIARDIGVVASETTANAWVSQAEQDFMDTGVRKMSDAFFKGIGLEFFTRFSREFASNMGVMFLVRHAEKAKAGDPTSQRYLDELGVTAQEVQAWEKSDRNFKTPHGKSVKGALQRFVESSILRPNAAERPVWASDPRFALIWQLKSYFYAFYKTIMQGVYREAKQRNTELTGPEQGKAVASLLMLTGVALMPLAMLGNELREYAKYGLAWLLPGIDAQEAYFRSDRMDWAEYMPEMFEKAGLLGPMSIPSMMFQRAEWGDSPLISLLGPTAETIDEALINGWDIGKTVKDRLLPGYSIL